MSHRDFYKFQAEARDVHTLNDVRRIASEKAYIYDRIVLPWLPTDKRSRISEIACGHGSFLCWLAERGYTSLTGIDSSQEQIEFARQLGIEVQQMDANQWLAGQPPGSQHIIAGIDLIEHLTKDEVMELLKAAYRALAGGGRLILRYPNGDSPLVGMNLFNDITHVWTYTPNCLNSLAIMHGFSCVHFVDESSTAIRDQRWLKVPICKISTSLLRFLFRAATREKVDYWSPHIWACLEKK